MKTLLSLVAALPLLAISNGVNVYEIDGVNQTGRVVTIGRVFAQGEIALCPQPVIGGTPVAAGLWQPDVRNRWPDGTVRHAVISWVSGTFAATGVQSPIFQSAACPSTATRLTLAQMLAFNSGNWGAQQLFTANGVTITIDAKTMLAQTDPAAQAQPSTAAWPDCGNNYLLQGSVQTQVLVTDCTATSQDDFGWHWNNTNMLGPGGVAGDGTVYQCSALVGGSVPINCATASPNYASIHPSFILTFVPSTNSVKIDFIAENDWVTRNQDQLYTWTLKAGSPLTTVYSQSTARRNTASDGSWTNTGTANTSLTVTCPTCNFTGADVGMPISFSNMWSSTIGSVISSSQARVSTYWRNVSSAGATSKAVYIGLHANMTRRRKTFWSGTTPGRIRIDHGSAYLISTKMIPNYDPGVKISANQNGSGSEGYADFVNSDMGDLNGQADNWTWGPGWGNDNEGAPLQRGDLNYIYNNTPTTSFDGLGCGNANSHCAMAWQALTGEKGAIDTNMANGPNQPTTLATPYTGGGYALAGDFPGGIWVGTGSIPYHLRESRTQASGAQSPAANNLYYCPPFSDVNSLSNTTSCAGGAGNATGKPFSRHAHADGGLLNFGLQTPIGTTNNNGINLDGGHWLDKSYFAYLVTGDYYFLEEEQMAASWLLAESIDGVPRFALSGGNRTGARQLGWGLQTVAHAAYITPDSSNVGLYYLGALNINLSAVEGILNVTGSALTPTAPSAAPMTTNCSTYNGAATSAWNWGRCGFYSAGLAAGIPNFLHDIVPGNCPKNTGYGTITSVASTGTTTTFNYAGGSALGTRSAGVVPVSCGYPISLKGVTGTWAAGITTNSTVRTPSGSCSTGVANCGYVVSCSIPPTSTQFTINFNSTGYSAGAFPAGVTWVATSGTTEFTDPQITQDGIQDWMTTGSFTTGLGHIQEIGLLSSTLVMQETQKRIVEQILESGGLSIWYPITYVTPSKLQTGIPNCSSGNDTSPTFTTWAQARTAAAAGTSNFNSFLVVGDANINGNFACTDHAYGLMARSAVAYAKQNNTNSTYADCPLVGGSPLCQASVAWDYVAVNGYAGGGGAAPYFGNAAYTASPAACTLGNMGLQAKFAIIPRVGVTPPGGSGTTLVTVTATGVTIR